MTEKDTKDKAVRVQTGRVERRVNESAFTPLVDIYETPDGTTMLLAELPGVRPDSIDIRVEKGVLSIAAEAELSETPQGYSRTFTSFALGPYFRAFALSDEVDRDRIEAAFRDGVLTLRLPRAAAAQARKIEIKGE